MSSILSYNDDHLTASTLQNSILVKLTTVKSCYYATNCDQGKVA